jgi:hypothetical protein
MTLFDEESGRLSVVKADFITAETLLWEELFSGFDVLRAITYSTGMSFVCKILRDFGFAEIIFGCPAVLSYNMQEIIAYQMTNAELLKSFKENAKKNEINLAERIDSDTLRLFVAHKQLSHEKIYLLEAEDGRRRVITGSANLSNSAFSGIQRENICYFDGDTAFDYYSEQFERLKAGSTDRITEKAFLAAVSDSIRIDVLPIAETVRVKKALAVESVPSIDEETHFALDVKNLSKQVAEITPKPDKSGKILVVPDTLKQIQRRFSENVSRGKELKGEYPELVIGIETQSALLNGKPLDLSPEKGEIKRDTALFLDYMAGFDSFHGEKDSVKARYFELANWFFASPFMARLRYVASSNNRKLLPYPVFALLYGQSKAGKTSFLETLLKMMIGQKPKVSAPEFTRSSIEALKHTVKGAPIIVDDIAKKRFDDHTVETIKHDEFGVAEQLVDYPAVILSANEDVKVVAPELVRRMVVFRVSMGLTNMEIVRGDNRVPRIQKDIVTAFYHEYLRCMMPQVQEMLDYLRSDDMIAQPPDVLEASSEIFTEIIMENAEEPNLARFARKLSLKDYFGEKVTGDRAIKAITDAWHSDKRAFTMDKRRNELRYKTANYYEARNIVKELPEFLEPRQSNEWIIMLLDKAHDFFSIDFRKHGFLF